jgi:hypothetical protein
MESTEKLLAPELTPGGAFKAQIDRFLASKFPFARRATADLDAAQFAAECAALLRAMDYARLPELIDRLWKRRDELMDPRPGPGEPQPWSADAQIKKHLANFSKWMHNPRVIDHIRSSLENGEEIIAVEPRAVRTSIRTWARAELEASVRYVTERSNRSFERQFLAEAEIAALIVENDARDATPEVPWASANRSALGPQ